MKFLTTFFDSEYFAKSGSVVRFFAMLMLGIMPVLYVPILQAPASIVSYFESLALASIVIGLLVISHKKSDDVISRRSVYLGGSLLLMLFISVLFSKSPYLSLLGDGVQWQSFVGMSIGISLAVLISHVRGVERRAFLKAMMFVSLFVAILQGVVILMGGAGDAILQTFFLPMAGTLSFAMYYLIGSIYFLLIPVTRSNTSVLKKIATALIGVYLMFLSVYQFSRGEIRPSLRDSSSLIGSVLSQGRIFGVGLGLFDYAWKEHHVIDPKSVNNYDQLEFSQGFSFGVTQLTNIGILSTIVLFAFVVMPVLLVKRVFKNKVEAKRDLHAVVFVMASILVLNVGLFVVPFSYGLFLFMCGMVGVAYSYVPTRGISLFEIPKVLRYVFVVFIMISLSYGVLRIVGLSSFFAVVGAYEKDKDADVAIASIENIASYSSLDLYYRALANLHLDKARALASSGVASDTDAVKKKYIGEVTSAIDMAKQAIAYRDVSFENYLILAKAYEFAVVGGVDKAQSNAEKTYDTAILLYPNNPSIYLSYAKLKAASGDKVTALDLLKKALVLKPDYGDAYYFSSQISSALSNPEQALDNARQAVLVDRKNVAYILQYGLLLYQAKKYDEAKEALIEGLKLDNNNTVLAYYLAQTLYVIGEKDGATTIAKELVARNPESKELMELYNFIKLGGQGTVDTSAKNVSVKR